MRIKKLYEFADTKFVLPKINYSRFNKDFENIITDLSDRKDIFQMNKGFLEIYKKEDKIVDVRFEHDIYYDDKRIFGGRNYYPCMNIILYAGEKADDIHSCLKRLNDNGMSFGYSINSNDNKLVVTIFIWKAKN